MASRFWWIAVPAGVLSQLFRLMPFGDLDVVPLSHVHSDHLSDLDVLKYAMQMQRRAGVAWPNLPVYLPAQPAAAVPAADGVLDLHFCSDNDRIQIGPVAIQWIAGEHSIQSYGMRFDAGGKIVAYTGDTRWCHINRWMGPMQRPKNTTRTSNSHSRWPFIAWERAGRSSARPCLEFQRCARGVDGRAYRCRRRPSRQRATSYTGVHLDDIVHIGGKKVAGRA